MKVYLQFDIPEENDEYQDAMEGSNHRIKFEQIWDKLFRPRHKHGYSNEKIQKLLANKQCQKLMDELELVFKQIAEGQGD